MFSQQKSHSAGKTSGERRGTFVEKRSRAKRITGVGVVLFLMLARSVRS